MNFPTLKKILLRLFHTYVSKYYKKAVTINDPDQLGGAMVKNFLELFDTKK